jgi:cellobiose phosphorylase
VAGPLAMAPCQAGWTWYTGTAAWYLRTLVEGVLGIEAHLEGLKVQAALPDQWDHFRVRRMFRGAIYDITVRRAAFGERSGCLVNGQDWPGEFLPIADPDTIQTVGLVI